jgi:hypothetical protein
MLPVFRPNPIDGAHGRTTPAKAAFDKIRPILDTSKNSKLAIMSSLAILIRSQFHHGQSHIRGSAEPIWAAD